MPKKQLINKLNIYIEREVNQKQKRVACSQTNINRSIINLYEVLYKPVRNTGKKENIKNIIAATFIIIC